MGLFGLFSDKPTSQSIQKLTVKVKERYAQPEYRREAMEKLLAWGTPEALAAVLTRFTVVAQSPHWDEEEKRWLAEELAEHGEPARQALLVFLAKNDHIAFAARALEKLGDKDSYVQGLLEVLAKKPPDDYRSTQGKTEIVACLGETGDPRVLDALMPYLDDHGDDVQTACIDVIERRLAQANDETKKAITTKLQSIVVDDTRSARVLRHAATAMHKLKLQVDVSKPLAPAVTEDFKVQDGLLVR